MKIGTDIEDISRFENKTQAFLDRVFTEKEQAYCFSKSKPENHFAARFCAKEATIKALTAMNLPHPNLVDIEICHNENKSPIIKLPNEKFYSSLKLELSISHDKTKAVAFVTIEE